MRSDKTLTPGSMDSAAWQIMLTPHAEMRVQQRGVDRQVLDCLVLYGRQEFDHFGCEILYFDEASLDAVARHEARRLWLKVAESRCLYAVVNSDGKVVTTGHRYRRVQRDRSLSSYRPGRTRSSRRKSSKA
jgi:hypothetical protein